MGSSESVMPYKKRILLSAFFLCLILHAKALHAAYVLFPHTNNVEIYYAQGLERSAAAVADRHPDLTRDLEAVLGLSLTRKPTVVLMKDSAAFQRYVGSDLLVALAMPDKNRIIIDHPRVTRQPFSLGTVLKHELCHLILHAAIQSRNLPRWLDEGVSQWVSDGIAEIVIQHDHAALDEAVLSRTVIPLKNLTNGFPEEPAPLQLAYDESRSFVEYLVQEYGEEELQNFLLSLKRGDTVEAALQKHYAGDLKALEIRWLASLKKKATWLTFFMNHLYEILFFCGALLTMIAFLKSLRRKRVYRDMEEG